MKRRTTRLILDCMMCDAMSPEFKVANDILIRIIKTNDRTDGVPYPRLVELNKAFKANDVKAAKADYDKLVAFIPKGEKTLHDELNESQEKLAETTKQIETTKKALAQEKAIDGMFDKFAKTIDTAKANPKMLPKLNAYAEKLKQYGDFSRRISALAQMANQKKDITKQCDMLKKAIEAGKVKFAKEQAKLAKDNAAVLNRLQVYKEMDKIRTKKIAEFQQESNDIAKLGGLLPKGVQSTSEENPQTKEKRTTASYITGKTGKIGYGAYLSIDGKKITVETKPGFPMPYVLNKGIWMEKSVIGGDAYIPQGDPRFKPKGGKAYLVWGTRMNSLPEKYQ